MEAPIVSVKPPMSLLQYKEMNKLTYIEGEIQADDYIQAECYIEVLKQLYIVKQLQKIKNQGKTSFKIKAEHNSTELNEYTIAPFEWKLKTGIEMLTLALAGTDWTIGTVNVAGTKTVSSDKRITVLAAIQLIVNAFMGELDFKSDKLTDGSWTRIVDLKIQIGNSTKKLPLRYDNNADYIEKRANTEKLCTRLYIYGKDDITISTVNGGLIYLDSAYINNYKYRKETVIYTNIDVVATLLLYAQIYLGANEIPLLYYVVNIFDKSIFPLWDFDTLDLGDTARVYDYELDVNVDVRIKKITKDLAEQDDIKIELANRIDDITDLLSKLNESVLNNTYQNNPNDYIPETIPGYGYDEPYPIRGINTMEEDTISIAGALGGQRKIICDSAGYFHAVWTSCDNYINYHGQVFYGRSEDNGKTWAINQLSIPDANYAYFDSPTIAMDSSDTIYIVCHASGGARVDQIVLYKSTDRGATWSAVFEIPFAGFWNESPILGIDNDDHLHVVMFSYYSHGEVRHKESNDGGANWSADVAILNDTIMPNITLSGDLAFEVSHDANDTMHMGIVVTLGGKNRIVYYNSIDSGAHWINLKYLNYSLLNNASGICFAIGNVDYKLYYVWVETGKIYFNSVDNNIWQTPEVISNPLYVSSYPCISLDKLDRVYAAWTSNDGDPLHNRQLKMRVYSLNTVWGPEYTRTTTATDKIRPSLVHAQNPNIAGLRPCIMNDGFALIYEDGTSIKFWVDYEAIF